MRNNKFLTGALTLALVVVLAGCDKKDSGGGLSKSEARDLEKFDEAMKSGDLETAVAIAKKADSKIKNIAQPIDFSYKLTEDEKGIVITDYDGPGGVVIVPSVIEDYPVVEIWGRVFRGKEYNRYYRANEITELVLPNTVTVIGNDMCSQNENLAKVTLPAGLKVIPNSAFFKCPNLTAVRLPESVESIECQAFWECYSLTTVNLPANLKRIDFYAFATCSKLFNLDIPDSLTSIEFDGGSFFGCGKLPIKTRQRLKDLGYTGGF